MTEHYEETFLDGSIRRLPAVRYKNCSGTAVGFEVLREEAIPRRDERDNAWRPARMLRVHVEAGKEVVLPADVEVHQTRCNAPGCVTRRGCTEPGHERHRDIVASLAPQLSRISAKGEVDSTPMAPALVEEAPKPSELADLHARVMARLAKAGAR